ncbi:MAG: Asp23/Gls24 family envelope stress response protein [Candidatus Goldiibacteriota bacterium]
MEEKNEAGKIKISDEAIATIAAIAAIKVEGVAALDAGAVGGIAEALGVKNQAKGIKVEMGKDSVSMDVNIIVSFGTDISDVASKVQEAVRKAIEKMTGLVVNNINVNINSVQVPEKK